MTKIAASTQHALYSKSRTHGVHNHEGGDCWEYVVGACLLGWSTVDETQDHLRAALERSARTVHDSGKAGSRHVYPGDMEYVRYRFEDCPHPDCMEVRVALDEHH